MFLVINGGNVLVGQAFVNLELRTTRGWLGAVAATVMNVRVSDRVRLMEMIELIDERFGV